MNTDLSIITLVTQASPIVKVVLLLLLIASIASWAVIIEKSRLLKQAVKAANAFETSFWSGTDLSSLYKEVTKSGRRSVGMAGIFEAGFREFGRLKQESELSSQQLVESARRSMNVSQMREVDRLEQNLAFLATVGSTSPYVGLFGTVWGIMNSFQSLGNVQSATISLVAPGIAEALVATAMGLFAAIPAVIFFNRYADRVGRLEVRYDTFMEELSAIFQRTASRKLQPAGVTR
jgi:biopolymer transport protein TolQ